MKLSTILIYLSEGWCFKHKIRKEHGADYGGTWTACPKCSPNSFIPAPGID